MSRPLSVVAVLAMALPLVWPVAIGAALLLALVGVAAAPVFFAVWVLTRLQEGRHNNV